MSSRKYYDWEGSQDDIVEAIDRMGTLIIELVARLQEYHEADLNLEVDYLMDILSRVEQAQITEESEKPEQ